MNLFIGVVIDNFKQMKEELNGYFLKQYSISNKNNSFKDICYCQMNKGIG